MFNVKKVRVLVCIPCLLTGGTEVQTLSLVEALVSLGHEVGVGCYFEHDGGDNGGMVKKFMDAGARIFLFSPDGKRPRGIKRTAQFLWKSLRKVVRDFKPDVAHVQYMAPGALPIVILKLLGVRGILATSHTSADIYSRNGLKIIHFLTRFVLDGFQCITLRAEESYFGEAGLLKSRIEAGRRFRHFTIYNALPGHVGIKDNVRKEKSPGEEITIGVVSRLERIKGMDLVIPAFSNVAQCETNVRLLIVGDGSLRDGMYQQSQESGLSARIEFKGRKSQDELSEMYDRIDILLMPSRSEGFGLTALEGMARGCVPVVASTGGLPEVVRDGEEGLLHRTESISDIADKILNLIKDPKKMLRMSDQSIERAKEFSSSQYCQQIATLYERIKVYNS